MNSRRPRFLRWIEEAEARRLRERALLEPEASRPRGAARPAIAAAGEVLRVQVQQSKTSPQTDQDGQPAEGYHA
jgi:hypothetical protein